MEEFKMKQLICEMCGSTDLVKQEGVFVCQECGCKYSVEEAKKMMTLSNKKSEDKEKQNMMNKEASSIHNLLELALNEKNNKNYSKAAEICDQIIALDSNNYEPWLYKGQCELWQSKLIDLRIQQAISNFEKAVEKAPQIC